MAALNHTGSTDILFPEPNDTPRTSLNGNESFYSVHSTRPGRSPSGRSPVGRSPAARSPDVRFTQDVNNGYPQNKLTEHYPDKASNANIKSFDDDVSRANNCSFDEDNGSNSFNKREGSSRSYIAQIKNNISKYVNPSLDNFKKLSKDNNANIRPRSTPKARERASVQKSCQALIPPPQTRRENQRNSYGGHPVTRSPYSANSDRIGRNRNSIDSGFTYTRQDSFANFPEKNYSDLHRKLPVAPSPLKLNLQPQGSFSSAYSSSQGDTYTVEELYTIPHTFTHQAVFRQKHGPPPHPPPKPRAVQTQDSDKSRETSQRQQSFQNTSTATPRRPHSDAGILDDPRRRTWSPAAFSSAMSSGTGFPVMRTYHSNDALDDVVSHGNEGVYADVTDSPGGPPRIAPVSGRLQQNAHKSLIKPIAFKPVLTSHPRHAHTQPNHRSQLSPHPAPHESPPSPPDMRTYGSTMRSNAHTRAHDSPPDAKRASYDLHATSTPRVTFDPVKVNGAVPMIPDDGYVSQDYSGGLHSHSNSNTSHGSFNGSVHGSHNGGSSHNGSLHNDSDRSMDRSMEQPTSYLNASLPRNVERPEAYNAAARGRAGDGAPAQTPSPSDSGLGELEAMLRDKDAMIQQLRDTMERNENAILQVCAEKEQNWEQELADIHGEWERRWRHHTERAQSMEQALLQQLFKAQHERKSLRTDLDNASSESERAQASLTDCQGELKQTKTKLEEVNWQLAQKAGEIALLKSQLKDSQDEATIKGSDMVNIKTALKHAQHSSDGKDHEILTLEATLKAVREQLASRDAEISAIQRDVNARALDIASRNKELHSVRQQADLTQLQLEMKCKELERLQTEHKACASLKSSPRNPSPVGAIVKSVNNNVISTPPLAMTSSSTGNSPMTSPPVNPNMRSSPLGNTTVTSPTLPGNSPGIAQQSSSAEVANLRTELAKLREEFTHEREQWLDEKNKVIRYQKHLQLNYVQMYRKNKVLEAEVEQLTLELEKQNVCLMEPVKEAEESVC